MLGGCGCDECVDTLCVRSMIDSEILLCIVIVVRFMWPSWLVFMMLFLLSENVVFSLF